LAAKQIVRAWIAECRARIDAARLLVLRTAWRIDREGFEAARADVSLIKFHVAGVLQEVLDRAVQLHGALGLTDDTVLASWFAHERGARIYDGPDEVHKIAAAKQLLKPFQGQATDMKEALDLAKLAGWLERTLGKSGPLEVQQFPGGHSNLTYLVSFAGEPYVLRRPPFGSQVKSAHDMGREHRILSRLQGVFPRAPRPIAFCEDERVLGAKFYLMQRIPGLILRRDAPAGLDAATAARLCESFVAVLAELHAVDFRAVGLGDLGQPEGYVERQVTGWSRRYQDARTDEIPEVPRVAAWLAAHLPASGPPALLHNDYKLDNLVLDPADLSRIVGVLDWEMSTLGDPLMDLGSALCYWVDPGDPEPMQRFRFGPTQSPGMLSRRQVAERYAARTGRDLSQVGFYYAFGLFKTAVVAQQIYQRWVQGHTRDPRFASFLDAVRALARQAAQVIEHPSL
ncbi:MAG: phosphotransferase family protein, partial [Myxococcales bacterium]